MTYGENGTQIRAGLSGLLRQHRIQHRLGGRGTHTLPETTTVEQRREMGERIRRYRAGALMWCLQAVEAANPRINLETFDRARRPAAELHHRLATSYLASDMELPSLEEMTTAQEVPIVESWRQIAKAAALGEHDFMAGVGHGRLSERECLTVLNDAAEVTRAIVVLDKRYANVPGWQQICERGRLRDAAEACSDLAAQHEPDFSVDSRGWRPPSALIEGQRLPGIGGVLQAQHNMLVHLSKPPNALNLRRVLDGQRIVSHEAARRASQVAPELVERWVKREQTYQALTDEARNVGGLVGDGGPAAAEAANAVSRLHHVHVNEVADPACLQDLDKLFIRIDARVASVIEEGVAENRYFVGVKVPRLVDAKDHQISPLRQRYVPITSPVQTDLLRIVRHDLRPASAVAAPVPKDRGRVELHESIEHRPQRRSAPDR